MSELGTSLSDLGNRVGFKFDGNGPHSSRTMMLADIARCLDALPGDAARADYQAAIIERNLLGKNTEAGRRESFRRLRELYGLDPAIPLFCIYRQLDALDPAARPLLSMLLASARDPLLRATFPVILGAREGDALGTETFDAELGRAFPGYLKPKIRAATARHIASTWQQSGHLSGRAVKTRIRVTARPAALTLALILGWLQGLPDEARFGSPWCQVLDVNAARARALAAQAHREGLLDLRAVGAVVEVSFPRFAACLKSGDPHGPL